MDFNKAVSKYLDFVMKEDGKSHRVYLNRELSIKLIKEKYGLDQMAAAVFLDKYIKEEHYVRDMQATEGKLYLESKIKNFFIIITEAIYSVFKKDYSWSGYSKEDILTLINNFSGFVFGGSIMDGIVNDTETSLSNCFVVGVPHDSYNGILMTEQHMINILKRRGGVGTDLSFIRSKGSKINNAALTSAGIVPFAKRYSRAIMEVSSAEGRRGAGMLTLNINHPDIVDFINSKVNTSELNGVNISIKIPDSILNRVIDDDLIHKDYVAMDGPQLVDPGINPGVMDADNQEQFVNPYEPKFRQGGKKQTTLTPKFLLDLITKNATKYAEPGVLFWDRILDQQDAVLYDSEGFMPYSTNPCGEIPMSQYSSCILGSMVLTNYVNNPFTDDAEFDAKRFIKDSYLAQLLMDIIVSLEIERVKNLLSKLKTEAIRQRQDIPTYFSVMSGEIILWSKILDILQRGRRTGLGMMGYADTVAMLGFKFDSRESLNFMESISKTFLYATHSASVDMAKNISPFPACSPKVEIYDRDDYISGIPFFNSLRNVFNEYDKSKITLWRKYGRRNIQSLAIAPTGTISMLAGVSSGIEPVFSLRYKRRRRALEINKNTVVDKDGNKWEEFNVIHPLFKKWAEINGIEDNLETISDKKFTEIAKRSPYYDSTTYKINPFVKVSLQGIAQTYIDNSISITHNLPKGTTPKTVMDLLVHSYQSGNKGFTVYVDGSRTGILVDKNDSIVSKSSIKRPEIVDAKIHFTNVNGKRFIVIVGFVNNKPYEVFAFKTKKSILTKNGFIRKTKSKKYELLDMDKNVIVQNIVSEFEKPGEEFGTRLISTALRHGADIKFIYEQLIKSEGNITHFSKAIARILVKYVNANGEKKDICPVCKSTNLVMKDGCISCLDCGWSKCS